MCAGSPIAKKKGKRKYSRHGTNNIYIQLRNTPKKKRRVGRKQEPIQTRTKNKKKGSQLPS